MLGKSSQDSAGPPHESINNQSINKGLQRPTSPSPIEMNSICPSPSPTPEMFGRGTDTRENISHGRERQEKQDGA